MTMAWPTKALDNRFSEKWIPEPNTGCHLWIGSTDRYGYGYLEMGSRARGNRSHWAAHRVAWHLAFGPVPEDACVLHKCDTPACVNPNHLFLGSKLDNARDMAAKGRQWMQRKCRDKHADTQNR